LATCGVGIVHGIWQIFPPTLITCGRYGELGPSCAATLQAGLPKAKTVIFENSANVSHIEKETAYLTNLRGFRSGHDCSVYRSCHVE
jgi:hypothetical protein